MNLDVLTSLFGITTLSGSGTGILIAIIGPAYDYRYWNDLGVSVQSELPRRGYYKGAIDGVTSLRIWDPDRT